MKPLIRALKDENRNVSKRAAAAIAALEESSIISSSRA